jgi:catechol 2,3-dioxygenase-like lactoylglutathione lyase family enzyme
MNKSQQSKPVFHSVVLFVADIGRSKEFYKEVLKQEIEFDFGNNVGFRNGLTIWQFRKDHLIAISGDHNDTGAKKAFEIYFETDDIEVMQESIAGWGLDYLHDLVEEPWGQRTIRFYDPDNNLIEVGEAMDTFVRRIASTGKTAAEVSAITTVPEEIVRKILEG